MLTENKFREFARNRNLLVRTIDGHIEIMLPPHISICYYNPLSLTTISIVDVNLETANAVNNFKKNFGEAEQLKKELDNI